MAEPEVSSESHPPANEVTEDRRRAPRATVPPPAGRTAALFPHDPAVARPPSRGRELLREVFGRRRNLIPLVLIVALAVAGLGLLLRRAPQPSTASIDQWLTRIVVSSSAPATSLFANDHYLGEIGPEPREFTVAPGVLHLRVVRRYCQASDSAFEFRAGERHAIGPLNPICTTPTRTP
jgi:hypothetical protein